MVIRKTNAQQKVCRKAGGQNNNRLQFFTRGENHQGYSLYQLSKRIRPFDLYSEFSGAAFYTEHERDLVFIADGHYDDWVNSRFSDFTTYLELVVQPRVL